MEERRSSRVGTVSGLALLVGGTAIAAASGGGTHSVFATFLLILLTAGLAHSLTVEIRRQARRGFPARWSRSDSVNAVLLGIWAELSLMMAILQSGAERYVGLGLAAAYAAACAYFVTERRRAAKTPATMPSAKAPAMAAPAAAPAAGSASAAGSTSAAGSAAGSASAGGSASAAVKSPAAKAVHAAARIQTATANHTAAASAPHRSIGDASGRAAEHAEAVR
ncbi:hypothetical protein ACQP2X_00090 [Actinoplanes sp. CA-131856]